MCDIITGCLFIIRQFIVQHHVPSMISCAKIQQRTRQKTICVLLEFTFLLARSIFALELFIMYLWTFYSLSLNRHTILKFALMSFSCRELSTSHSFYILSAVFEKNGHFSCICNKIQSINKTLYFIIFKIY